MIYYVFYSVNCHICNAINQYFFRFFKKFYFSIANKVVFYEDFGHLFIVNSFQNIVVFITFFQKKSFSMQPFL